MTLGTALRIYVVDVERRCWNPPNAGCVALAEPPAANLTSPFLLRPNTTSALLQVGNLGNSTKRASRSVVTQVAFGSNMADGGHRAPFLAQPPNRLPLEFAQSITERSVSTHDGRSARDA